MIATTRSIFCNTILPLLVFISVLFLNESSAFAMDVNTIKEQLFFTTVRIETITPLPDNKQAIKTGTGFIVEYTVAGKKTYFIATNKHVVIGAATGKFFFIKSVNGKAELGSRCEFKVDKFEGWWFGHPDPKVDVAVMPLAPVLEEAKKGECSVFFRAVPKELVPTKAQEKTIDAIEDVVFIGYPRGLIDVKNLLPIARKGITATPYAVDYAGLPVFLVDAAVYEGSSGSPVFIASEEKTFMGRGVTRRLWFLGLIASVFSYNEFSPVSIIPSENVTQGVVGSNKKLDLGIVFKSSTIFETIDALLKKQAGK